MGIMPVLKGGPEVKQFRENSLPFIQVGYFTMNKKAKYAMGITRSESPTSYETPQRLKSPLKGQI
ncbi:MAG: hypothetical protein RL151_95 [Bacteroidota bacterium]